MRKFGHSQTKIPARSNCSNSKDRLLSKLKRALLIVDRGSREPEVNQELSEICSLLKLKGNYDYSDYCFLEVLPPFIEEGIRKCVQNGSVFITIIPYFLYPGLKLKETVKAKCDYL